MAIEDPLEPTQLIATKSDWTTYRLFMHPFAKKYPRIDVVHKLYRHALLLGVIDTKALCNPFSVFTSKLYLGQPINAYRNSGDLSARFRLAISLAPEWWLMKRGHNCATAINSVLIRAIMEWYHIYFAWPWNLSSDDVLIYFWKTANLQ